jgi:outer membrane protein OmpA-like peptidoglycan-associated protein
MNTRTVTTFLAALATIWVAALPASAADVPLSVVQFPERSSVDLQMAATIRVAPATGEASVKFKEGQARIEIDYKKLPPAILFGGDVTSYVVWAVARDGHAENLGELIVRDSSGSGEYRTGQKEFALMVTAEPYYLVLQPSDLVCFVSLAPARSKATSAPITFSGFGPAPTIGNAQIGAMQYTGGQPVDLIQAQHVHDQAKQMGAEKYAADSIRQSETALTQATNSFNSGNKKVGIDYARRSLSLSSTAIRDTRKQMAAEEAAAAAARRAAEMQALEQQKTTAQQQAAAAQEQALAERERALAAREQAAAAQSQLAQAQQQATAAQQQAAQAQKDAAAAQDRAAAAGLSAEAAEAARRDADDARSKAETLAAEAQSAKDRAATLEAQNAQLGKENVQLGKENERLQKERDDLAGRLTGALSEVAQISKTARGVVVNLPDILFDVNKATLKQNAQNALAKLAGIVSLFPNINLRIEGHTDSTGTDELNMRLSKDRAASVMAFLRQQGVAEKRMSAEGYGPKLPVADNATAEGRAKNRRVEIILAEGEIKGAGGN